MGRIGRVPVPSAGRAPDPAEYLSPSQDEAGRSAAYPLPSAFAALLDTLYAKRWVVYSKPPFGGPQQVLQYLARYTHRVAISNHRLVRLEGDQVVFTFKDYAHGHQVREMTLSAEEFIRRFLLHILPERFVRIRYYGLLANRHRDATLTRCRALLGQSQAQVAKPAAPQDWRDLLIRLTGTDPTLCPRCGEGHLHQLQELPPLHPTAAGPAAGLPHELGAGWTLTAPPPPAGGLGEVRGVALPRYTCANKPADGGSHGCLEPSRTGP